VIQNSELRTQKSERKSDPFQFTFWLKWILLFAGAFTVSAALWTLVLERLAGTIRGEELSLTWSVSVFGSWFLIVIPFMRKKERIWKRLNVDQEKAVDAWLTAMGFFIGFLIASCFFWTWKYRDAIAAPGLDGGWIKAVFGTWLAGVMPLLVLLYRKADSIFKNAVARQNAEGPCFRTAFVARDKRLLAEGLQARLRAVPPVLQDGHLVHAHLADGRVIPHVFVLGASEVIGLYDQTVMDFEASQIVNVEPLGPEEIPAYEEALWLRLDGRA